jgi:mono/diheme cytochrome c family protein
MKSIRARTARFAAAALSLAIVSPAFADSAGIRNDALLKTDSGARIYAHICQACHMPNGQGAVGAGRYPAFAHNPTTSSASYMALTILHGRRNMPAFAPKDPGDSESESFIDPVWLTERDQLHPHALRQRLQGRHHGRRRQGTASVDLSISSAVFTDKDTPCIASPVPFCPCCCARCRSPPAPAPPT